MCVIRLGANKPDGKNGEKSLHSNNRVYTGDPCVHKPLQKD